jgi:hypothetical protein
MKMNKIDDQRFEEIEKSLIEAVSSFKPVAFIPTFFSRDISVDFRNKVSFYTFFQGMLMAAKARTNGILRLKIENTYCDADFVSYNFYDEVHLHPRFSIKVKRTEEKVFLEMDPF